MGEVERPETHALVPPWSPMSENDNKIDNIFRNYSSHNDIKNTPLNAPNCIIA